METFKLFHVLLYSKHWYKRFDVKGRSSRKTIFDDLKVCLSADGYYGEVMSNSDVVYHLLNHCKRTKIRAFTDLNEFVFGIADGNVWKNGYFTKTNDSWNKNREENPDYDYLTAVVYYCLSNLVHGDRNVLGVDSIPKPDFKNCLPRRNGITNKSIKIFFE